MTTRRCPSLKVTMIADHTGIVLSEYEARKAKADDIPWLLKLLISDMQKELDRVQNCPAARRARAA